MRGEEAGERGSKGGAEELKQEAKTFLHLMSRSSHHQTRVGTEKDALWREAPKLLAGDMESQW